jgi:hypothetical protein
MTRSLAFTEASLTRTIKAVMRARLVFHPTTGHSKTADTTKDHQKGGGGLELDAATKLLAEKTINRHAGSRREETY